MSPAELQGLGTVALTIVAIIGIVAAVVRWFYKRGSQEADVVIALRENSQATKDLTLAFHTFKEISNSEFRAMDVRLTKVEAAQNDHPALRNSRPG